MLKSVYAIGGSMGEPKVKYIRAGADLQSAPPAPSDMQKFAETCGECVQVL